MKPSVFIMIGLVSSAHATVILDSYEEGMFSLSTLTGSEYVEENVVTGVGSMRSVLINGRTLPDTVVVTSALASNSGLVQFSSMEWNAGVADFPAMRITYLSNSSLNLNAFDAFGLDIQNLQGDIRLAVTIGGIASTTKSLEIDNAGLFLYPLSSATVGPGHGLDSYNLIHFTFQATSPSASFELREIRVIPEPSTQILIALGALLVLLRHHTKHAEHMPEAVAGKPRGSG